MIQMCVYNSILAVRLGDCWLCWETASWPLGRLAVLGDCLLAPGEAATAGPWEGSWLAPREADRPLGRLLLQAALGDCWLVSGKNGWAVCSPCSSLVLLIFAGFAGQTFLGWRCRFLWVQSGYNFKVNSQFKIWLEMATPTSPKSPKFPYFELISSFNQCLIIATKYDSQNTSLTCGLIAKVQWHGRRNGRQGQ